VENQRLPPTARLRAKASSCTDRDGRGRRPLYVRDFSARPADGPQSTPASNGHSHPSRSHLHCSKAILEQYTNSNGLPDPAHGWPKTLHQRSANRSQRHAGQSRCHHPAAPALTCVNSVAGVGFEPT
jgi:hypothetical protein